jgi:hypothetical protein
MKAKNTTWNKEELNILYENVGKYSVKSLKNKFFPGRSECAIYTMIDKHGPFKILNIKLE